MMKKLPLLILAAGLVLGYVVYGLKPGARYGGRIADNVQIVTAASGELQNDEIIPSPPHNRGVDLSQPPLNKSRLDGGNISESEDIKKRRALFYGEPVDVNLTKKFKDRVINQVRRAFYLENTDNVNVECRGKSCRILGSIIDSASDSNKSFAAEALNLNLSSIGLENLVANNQETYFFNNRKDSNFEAYIDYKMEEVNE